MIRVSAHRSSNSSRGRAAFAWTGRANGSSVAAAAACITGWIRQVGGDINVLYLVREWMPCRTRNKMANFCEAYVVI
jgi:hypothetical protein